MSNDHAGMYHTTFSEVKVGQPWRDHTSDSFHPRLPSQDVGDSTRIVQALPMTDVMILRRFIQKLKQL